MMMMMMIPKQQFSSPKLQQSLSTTKTPKNEYKKDNKKEQEKNNSSPEELSSSSLSSLSSVLSLSLSFFVVRLKNHFQRKFSPLLKKSCNKQFRVYNPIFLSASLFSVWLLFCSSFIQNLFTPFPVEAHSIRAHTRGKEVRESEFREREIERERECVFILLLFLREKR
jgi:hypothetical protein